MAILNDCSTCGIPVTIVNPTAKVETYYRRSKRFLESIQHNGNGITSVRIDLHEGTARIGVRDIIDIFIRKDDWAAKILNKKSNEMNEKILNTAQLKIVSSLLM